MAPKMTARLSMLGLPVADNIRWRLFGGLPVVAANRSNPTVAFTSSRRVRRAVSGSPLRKRLAASSLLEVDPHPVSVLPLERQTPRSVDVHAVADGPTLPPMEVETRHVEVREERGLVEYLQANQRATLKVLSYPAASPCFEQLAEPRVPARSGSRSGAGVRRARLDQAAVR
jgi:hypothetical protein